MEWTGVPCPAAWRTGGRGLSARLLGVGSTRPCQVLEGALLYTAFLVLCAMRKVMLSLLPRQTPAVFCKQNGDVCVRQQVDRFVIWFEAIHSSFTHARVHLLKFAQVSVVFKDGFHLFFIFFIYERLCLFKLNYTPNRVLFDPCPFSLAPYVFSWHLYHIVGLIQTQSSVCFCDFVAGQGGILAWLLVAALPACLYSPADLVTRRS